MPTFATIARFSTAGRPRGRGGPGLGRSPVCPGTPTLLRPVAATAWATRSSLPDRSWSVTTSGSRSRSHRTPSTTSTTRAAGCWATIPRSSSQAGSTPVARHVRRARPRGRLQARPRGRSPPPLPDDDLLSSAPTARAGRRCSSSRRRTRQVADLPGPAADRRHLTQAQLRAAGVRPIVGLRPSRAARCRASTGRSASSRRPIHGMTTPPPTAGPTTLGSPGCAFPTTPAGAGRLRAERAGPGGRAAAAAALPRRPRRPRRVARGPTRRRRAAPPGG